MRAPLRVELGQLLEDRVAELGFVETVGIERRGLELGVEADAVCSNLGAMCMQCAATAAVAVGSASGLRAWVKAKQPAWLTPPRMRAVSAALVSVAVLAAGFAGT